MITKKPKNRTRSPRDPLAYAETVYKDLVSELRTEIIRLKSAHAEELARVIEENKKILALAQGAVSRSTDSTDQETESGSSDSRPLNPGEATVSDLLAMLHNGAPFQRIIARSQLEQMEHDNRRLGAEREKLRRDFDAIKLEVDRLKAGKKPDDVVVAPKPPEPVQPTN